MDDKIDDTPDFSDLSRARTRKAREVKEGSKEERGCKGRETIKETIRTCRESQKESQLTCAQVLKNIPAMPGLEEAWREWVETRIQRGAKYDWPTELLCFQKSMKKCEQWGLQRALLAIDHSIEFGYRGLYEPPCRQSHYSEQLNGKKKYNPRTDPDRSVLS